MPDLRIGTAELPPRLAPARYFEALEYLETSLFVRGVPADKVLRRWRALAPSRGLGVLAPRALTAGRLAPDAARTALLEQFAAAAVQLDAGVVVFRTPADLTPSSASRDALRRFFAEHATAERFPGMTRVWQPDGLWELGATARFAPELGVLAAFDPLAQDPGVDLEPAIAAHLERGAAYLRPTGLGRPRGQVSADDLEALAALVEPLDQAWVVFASQDGWKSARTFKKVAALTLGPAAAPDAEEPSSDDDDLDDDEDDDDEDDDLDDDE